MPYKVIHVHESGATGTVDYDELSKLLEEGWEIEDTATVTYKGIEGVERYRLKQGPEETGLTATSGPAAHGNHVVAQGPGMFDGALMPQAGSAAQQIGMALSGLGHPLGMSNAHMIPGAQVVSGNSHQMVDQHAKDCANTGRGLEHCPFAPGTREAEQWATQWRAADEERRHPTREAPPT